MAGKTKQSVFNLLGIGEDTYSGQNAQEPRTARRLWSWKPGTDGQLHRELPEPLFASTQLSGPICGLFEYDRNNGDSTFTRYYFAAARTDFSPGTKTCNLYQLVAGAWNFTGVNPFPDVPQCKTFQNLFHVSDGVRNLIFDGSTWNATGFQLLPGSVKSTATTTFPDGTNGPAIVVSQPTNLAPVITGNVTAKFYSVGSGQNGAFGLFYPLGAALASATNNSLMFNPIQLTGTADPNVQPIQWATLDVNGLVTGFTTPYAGATHNYNMVVVANVVITKAGTYTVQIAHDDGMIWGISNGASSGLAPFASGPFVDAYSHTQTALNGYGGSGGGILAGGTNARPLSVPGWTDVFSVSFPAPDTYTFEIDFTNLSNEQQLVVTMALAPGTPTVIAPGTGAVHTGIDAVIGRQYWYTLADETAGRGTESDSSPQSVSTGPVTAASVKVYPLGGNFSCSVVSISVTVVTDTALGPGLSDGTDGQLAYILGKTLYINGVAMGTIVHYTTSGAQNYLATITLAAPPPQTINNGYGVICDPRTTHWHLYASESDGSQIGQFLASIPITQNLKTTPYVDKSPFLDDVTNQFLPIFRPVRNDPPPPSKLLEVHKSRLWRRREAEPNFFNYTANEEVASGDNGDPTECVPGADKNTLSDLVNEVSFPTQSSRIRAFVSHSEALYMFSERQCYPLYGQSYDDFAISQVTAFSLGIAGRFAGRSTPHGLPFISYDCKGYLYPVQSTIWNLTPQANATEALVEIGKSMRNVFRTIVKARLDEVYTEHYFFGIRDWWVICLPTGTTPPNDFITYAYSFATKAWFKLQRGFSSVAVFEIGEGEQVLIGGGSDGYTYVIDDQNGIYATPGNLPVSTYRPALINFGDDSNAHRFVSLEIEVSSAALAQDISATFWLDPNDVDNPGTGRVLKFSPIIGANRYIAYPETGTAQGGAVCQRMLLSIDARASTHAGILRGVKLTAETVEGTLPKTSPNV